MDKQKRIPTQKQLERAQNNIIRKAEKVGISYRTKQDAVAAGLVRYFDAKLCPHGHIAERYVKTGVCTECTITKRVEARRKNPAQYSAYATNYVRQRCKTDPLFAVRMKMRYVLGNAIKRAGYKKNGRTEAILGCSFEEFKAHIERQFLPGMSWGNWGEWHIDHITPMKSAQSEAEAMALNHFTNLRPLWAEDNRKKAARIECLI